MFVITQDTDKSKYDFLDKIDLQTLTLLPIDAPKITTLTVKPKEYSYRRGHDAGAKEGCDF